MNKDEAMQQALELIERLNKHGWILADFEAEVYAAITALKAALEQQAEPVGFEIAQPVAWRFKDPKDGHWLYTTHLVDLSKKYWRLKNELFEPLYTAPPPPLPVQEPTPWRDMVVVSLVREGVNKHKARELADHFAAQPVQEPVGEVVEVNNDGFRCEFSQRLAVGAKLYTTPPAVERPWVALTEQDMPSGEDPMFDHKYFIAGMVYAAKVLQEKNNAAPAAQPEQQAEPVACRFCHSKKGSWTWQCYNCGEIDDVQKPAPPQQQAESVSMRMPKVGDKVICLEDESLGEVVSLTAGGSPDITFNDGSRGTYLLHEFAELFGYVTSPQQQAKPMAWDKPSDNFNVWWDGDRRRDNANPFDTDSFAYWAWEGWQAALAQSPWVGLTNEEIRDCLGPEAVRIPPGWSMLTRAIEAKLKEKNHG